MNNEQILKKAIEKAVKNGFKWTEFFGRDGFYVPGTIEEVVTQLFNSGAQFMPIFSHDFAKAFWGDEKEYFHLLEGSKLTYPKISWKGHLQQIVLEKDPIKYLEKFI